MSAMSWLSRGEMVALGWTLLHFCWQGTAVALAYSVIDRMTSRATSGVRYMVALLALMAMPVAVVATFVEEMQITAPVLVSGQTRGATRLDAVTRQGPVLREIPLAPVVEERSSWFAARAERVLPWVDGVWRLGVLLLCAAGAGRMVAVGAFATTGAGLGSRGVGARLQTDLRTGSSWAVGHATSVE